MPQGVHTAREEGEALKVTHWDMDPRPGLTRGYWVVKSERAWRDLWPTIEADRIPLLPDGINFATQMLVVAAPNELAATGARVHQVIDTSENGVHVYVSQQLPGMGCPAEKRDDKVPVDLALVTSVDKEVHFHVETRNDDPCSPPPEAKIGCHASGDAAAYSENLTVDPGKKVSCLSQGKPGSRPIADRTWSFRSLPPGAETKMTITNNGATIAFDTDVYGTYAVGLEVSDDLGRTAKATSDVNVFPSKDALVVQMVWTKFQPSDDPSTFPRVELHVMGDKTPLPTVALPGRAIPMAARSTPWILVKGDCTLQNEKPPAWCKGKAIGVTSIEELPVDAFPQYRIGVHYVDDRFPGQPVLCVRTFRGDAAAEWCDDKPRSAGSWWDVSRIDSLTGKVPVPPPPPPPKPSADGGAGGAVTDGGAPKDASPDRTTPSAPAAGSSP